jgi:hypothetical protein
MRRAVWAYSLARNSGGLRGGGSDHGAARHGHHAASGRAQVRHRTPPGAAQRSNRAATGTPDRPHRAAPREADRTRRATGRSRRHPGRHDDHRAKEVIRIFGKHCYRAASASARNAVQRRGRRWLQKRGKPVCRIQQARSKAGARGGSHRVAPTRREGKRGNGNFGIIALYACFARRRNRLHEAHPARRIHQALKPLILLAPATVHGVVFKLFDSERPCVAAVSASRRPSALPKAHPEGAPVLAADHDR